jgi:hypothetical protein
MKRNALNSLLGTSILVLSFLLPACCGTYGETNNGGTVTGTVTDRLTNTTWETRGHPHITDNGVTFIDISGNKHYVSLPYTITY